MNRTQIQDRIAKCRQILDANPGSQIFAALAEAYRKVGDLKSALDVCNDGLKLHPEYGSAYLVLAKIARDQKRFSEAEQAATRAIQLEGRTRSAELLLSDVYLQTGQFTKAESILARLAEADPLNESVRRLRALAKKAGQAASVTRSGSVAVLPELAETYVDHDEDGVEPEPLAPRAPARPAAPEASWEAILSALERYPHLQGKMTVGYDGMLLESDHGVRTEAEAVAAMAADLFGSVRGEWPLDRFGALNQVLVETDHSSWWIWPFPKFLLVLWCDPQINMGPLRMRLNQFEASPSRATQGGAK
jgi:predicted regulator of Ras-like GTPase activity (Roadblock/LC7/MglB family)